MRILLSPSRLQVIVCLVLVYLSWGSSFLSIKFAVDTFPPFMMCGLRMGLAGLLLYALSLFRKDRALPSWQDIRHYSFLSFFMVFMASGLLSKGQETVPSGTAALILGTVPIWMMVFGWLICHDPRPSFLQWCGLAIGTSGLMLLGLHHGSDSAGADNLIGILFILLAVVGWVTGSILSKKYQGKTALSLFGGSAVLMLLGGIQCLGVSVLIGEFANFSAHDVSALSMCALVYLILFGSIVGYSSFLWLLVHTRTAVAISYEYVNPVIGVTLGYFFGGEQVSVMIVMACCLTVSSVFFIVSGHGSERSPERQKTTSCQDNLSRHGFQDIFNK